VKLDKKTLVTALTFLLIGIIVTSVVWVYASPAVSPTMYLSGGAYPQATMTIWKSGSTYYAKNAYGSVLYESSNASYVINSAIQALPSYDTRGWTDSSGTVKLLAQNYTITHSIVLKDSTYLSGEGKFNTILTSTISDGSPVITTEGNSTSQAQYNIKISDLLVFGSGSDGDGIYFEYCVRNCLIENVDVSGVGGHGIHYYHSFSSKIIDVQSVNNGGDGINIEYNSHNIQVVTSLARGNTGYGLFQTGSSQLSILGGNYESNDLGDMYIERGYGVTVTGVYFENTNAGVYQLTLNGSVALGERATEVTGCYFNGGGSSANGILIDNTINVMVSTVYLESNGVGINITSNARYTILMNIYQSASPITDNGDGTIEISGYYVQFAQITHPTTTGWGASQKGMTWYCTTHDYIEYWNGTAIHTP